MAREVESYQTHRSVLGVYYAPPDGRIIQSPDAAHYIMQMHERLSAMELPPLAKELEQLLWNRRVEDALWYKDNPIERARFVLLEMDGLLEHDPYTVTHSVHHGELSGIVGPAAGLTEDETILLQRGGLLHDIGKKGAPITILNKPTRLSDDEYQIIQMHAERGYRRLRIAGDPAAPIEVAVHQVGEYGERYPRTPALHGEDPHYPQKVLASTIDYWLALAEDRPYRLGMAEKEVRERTKNQYNRALLTLGNRRGVWSPERYRDSILDALSYGYADITGQQQAYQLAA